MQSIRTRVGKILSSSFCKISEEHIDRKALYRELPLLFRDLGVLLLIFSLILLPIPSSAFASTQKKWGPHADITGKLGNERNLADIDIMVPLLQGPESMLFMDVRAQRSSETDTEGNFGLGYRQMLSDWIVGGYGFYDIRESENDNRFSQWTLGLEALSEKLDARFNLYLADEDIKPLNNATGNSNFTYVGNYLLYDDSFEQSLSGFDFEIGGPVLLLDGSEIRAYVGGYYFDTDEVKEIAGPKARVELRFPDLFSWDGSLFELGGEIRNDSERDTDYFFTARLRIPFGGGTFSQPTSSLTALEKRMTERVVRDPDIVTTRGGAATPLTYNSVVIDFTHINSDGPGGSGTAEDPYGSLASAAGAGTDIVLLYADSVYNGNGFVMSANQRLLGEADGVEHLLNTDQFGTIVMPRASTGTDAPVMHNTATFVTAGSNGEIADFIISGNGIGTGIEIPDGDVVVRNVVIDGINTGIFTNGGGGTLTMNSVTITDTANDGLLISGGTKNVEILNSTITQTASGNGLLMTVMGGHTGTVNLYNSSSMSSESSDTGLVFLNADGTYNFNAPYTYTGTGGAIYIGDDTDGTITFYNAVTIDTPSGNAITVNNTGGTETLTFTDTAPLTVTTGNGIGIVAASNGFLTVAGSGNSIDATGGPAVDINDMSTDMTFDSLSSKGSVGDGVRLFNVAGLGTAGNALTVTGTMDINTATDDGIDIQQLASESAVVFNGIVDIYNTVDMGIILQDNEGTITFNDNVIVDTTRDVGVNVNNNSGDISLYNAVTIDNSGGDGLYVNLNSGDVAFNSTLDVTNSARHGVVFDRNLGPITVSGATTIYNSVTGYGLAVVANDDSVSFNDTLDVTDSGFEGVNVANNLGTVTVAGATTIVNSGINGLFVSINYNAVSFNSTLDVTDSAVNGVNISGNTAPVTVAGVTTIYNSGINGLQVSVNSDAVSFNSTLDVTDSAVNGVHISGNTAPVSVAGVTTIYNSAGSGLYAATNSGDITFDMLSVDRSGNRGIWLNTNSGDFTAGATTIYNTTGVSGSGIEIFAVSGTVEFGPTIVADSNYNGIWARNTQATGDITYNSLTVERIGGTGVAIENNYGDFDVLHDTSITNTRSNGLYAGGAVANANGAVNFYGNLDVANTGVNGVNLEQYEGLLTVYGETTVYNSARNGIQILNTTGDADFLSNTTITNTGDAGTMTVGDGVNITNSSGTYNFNGLDVTTEYGSGLVTSNTYNVIVTDPNSGNSIVANFGSALDVNNSAIHVTYNTVASNNSLDEGILLDTVSGTLNITDTVTIYNSALTGLEVVDTSSMLLINTLDIDKTGEEGVLIENFSDGDGGVFSSLIVSNASVANTGGAGIAIYNSASNSYVAFDTVNIEDTGAQGIVLNGNEDVTQLGFTGGTTIYNTAAGFAAIEILANPGAVDLADVDIANTGAEGVLAIDSGSLTLIGGSIYNTAGTAVEIENTNLSIDNLFIDKTGAGSLGVAAVYNTAGSYTVDLTGNTLSNIGEYGIGIASYNSAAVSVTLTDNNVTSYNTALIVIDSDPEGADPTTGTATLEMSSNTFNSAVIPAVYVSGSAYNSVIITDMYNTTILGGQGGGGMVYDTVTFDAGVTAVNSDLYLINANISNTTGVGVNVLVNNGGTYNAAILNSSVTAATGSAIYASPTSGTINLQIYNSAALTSTGPNISLNGSTGTINVGCDPAKPTCGATADGTQDLFTAAFTIFEDNPDVFFSAPGGSILITGGTELFVYNAASLGFTLP